MSLERKVMRMRKYTLQFEDDVRGKPKSIDFDGEDPHQAFWILCREDESRRALLYEGEQLLGVIRRTSDDCWELSG